MEVELYPQRRAESLVRSFSLATEAPDVPALTAVLEGLGASLLYGPCQSAARPKACFVALRVPAGVSGKDLAKALRKTGAARELVCTVFDGHAPTESGSREDTLGMFSEVSWVDHAGPWTQMYLERAPSAKEAAAMVERYAMMYEQVLKLGQPARDRITWKLALAPDAKTAERVLKAIRKLDGVVGAAIAGTSLDLTVELLDLGASGDSGQFLSPSEGATTAPRATWSTQALHELLASEKLLSP